MACTTSCALLMLCVSAATLALCRHAWPVVFCLVSPDEACSRDKNWRQQSQHTDKQSFEFVEDGVHNIGCFTARSGLHVHPCGVATTHTPCRLLTSSAQTKHVLVMKIGASNHNTLASNPLKLWKVVCTTSGASLHVRVCTFTLAAWPPHTHHVFF